MTLEPDIDMGDSPTVDQSQDDLDIDAELTEDGKIFFCKITGRKFLRSNLILQKIFRFLPILAPLEQELGVYSIFSFFFLS